MNVTTNVSAINTTSATTGIQPTRGPHPESMHSARRSLSVTEPTAIPNELTAGPQTHPRRQMNGIPRAQTGAPAMFGSVRAPGPPAPAGARIRGWG